MSTVILASEGSSGYPALLLVVVPLAAFGIIGLSSALRGRFSNRRLEQGRSR